MRRFLTALFLLSLALFAASGSLAAGKTKLLIVTGQNNHNWRETTPHLKSFLEAAGKFAVEVTEDPATYLADPARLKDVDAFVLNYNGARWGEAAEKAFLEAVNAGKGVVVIHAANNAFPGWTEYEKMIGIAWRATAGHGAYHEFAVSYINHDHPVTKGLPDLAAHPDELYHRLTPAPDEPMTVLATAHSETSKGGTGNDEPMALAKSYGKGRIFHTPMGHDLRAMQDPGFMLLVSRGAQWAATGKVTIKELPKAQ
jgi:uncharacterized protein